MQLLDIRITLGSMLWLSSMPIFFCSEDKLLQPRHPKIIRKSLILGLWSSKDVI